MKRVANTATSRTSTKGFSKVVVATIVAFVAILGLAGCSITISSSSSQSSSQDTGQQNAAFAQFVKEYVLEAFSESYLIVHVYWLDPTAYGFDEAAIEPGWGATYTELYTEEAAAQNAEEYAQILQELETFDRNQLSGQVQGLYDWLEFTWEREQILYGPDYAYYPQAFAYGTDNISDIVTLLTTWRLDDEQDIQDLILLIDDTDDYLSGQLEYSREQAERGLLRAHVDSTVEVATTVVEAGLGGTLLTTLEDLIDQVGLDESSADQYKQQLRQVYEESLIAGFQDVIDTLEELENDGKINLAPLVELEGGTEYYDLLIQTKTGLNLTAAELEDELWEALENTVSTYYQTGIQNYDLIDIADDFTLNLESYEEELDLLAAVATTDFPDIGQLNYQIDTLDAGLLGGSVAAFFMSGAIDDTNPTYQMRVGQAGEDLSDTENALTVAHEGIPGHMYQYAYCLQNAEIIEGCILGNSGYQEGYAKYVEGVVTDYFTSDQTDADLSDDEIQTIMRLNNLNSQMSFYVVTLYEIAYNRGEDLSDVTTMLNNLGLSPADETEEQIAPISASNPTLYTLYSAGLDQFKTLREYAEQELGDEFSSIEFHRTLLDAGPTTFDNLNEAVETYVAETQ